MPFELLIGGKDDDRFILDKLPESLITNYEIRTGFGEDVVRSGALADVIATSKGNDRVWSGAGDDDVRTGNHNDFVNAGDGADYVSAGAGNDRVIAGKGNDTVFGGTGDDLIFGTKGNNYLDGGTGNDEIHTGRQTSTVVGGEGDDLIVADLRKGADHTLTGGTGADVFEFTDQQDNKASKVVITDFELGVDDLIIDDMTSAEWAALFFEGSFNTSVAETPEGDIVLGIGSNDQITLQGISVSDFLDHFVPEPPAGPGDLDLA